MIKTRIFAALLFVSSLAACGGGGSGEREIPEAQPADASSAVIGEHVVHFSAMGTDFLPPEVAKTYNIVRSKNRAMLNVTVVTAEDGKAAPADIDVRASNLTGQAKTVSMRRIDEGDAIYYIGVTPVAHEETLNFKIDIKPEGSSETYEVRFQRKFYTN